MKPFRFLLSAAALAGAGFWAGRCIPKSAEVQAVKAVSATQAKASDVQPIAKPSIFSSPSKGGTKPPPMDAVDAVKSLCSQNRLELAMEAYERLSLPERRRAAHSLGMCGGDLDLTRIKELAERTTDAGERRALYGGIFWSWSRFASDEASEAVAALPEGPEKRLQGSALGHALLTAHPRAGAKWLFASDFDAEDDHHLMEAAKWLGAASYTEAKQCIDDAPFTAERRSALEAAARTRWNQTCVTHGDWDKIIQQAPTP